MVKREVAKAYEEDRRHRLTDQFLSMEEIVQGTIRILKERGTADARSLARMGEDLLRRTATVRALPPGTDGRTEAVRGLIDFQRDAMELLNPKKKR